MKSTSRYVPQLEALEDRSVPGSLWSLAESFTDLFGTASAGSHRPAVQALSAKNPSSQPPRAAVSARPAPSMSCNVGDLSSGFAVVGAAQTPLAALMFSWDGPRAGSVARATKIAEVTVSQGNGAFAFFNHMDGCILTDISVTANKDTVRSFPARGSDGTPAFLGLSVFVSDTCAGRQIIDAQGFEVDPGMFRVAPDLHSATLNGTFHTLNLPTGQEFAFTVSITWKAVGSPSTETVISADANSFSILETRSRAAVATGMVTLGTTNYLSGPATDAAIQSVLSVDVTFQK